MAQEEIRLPQLGESVTEGIIIDWLVAEGDHVDEDQPLFELSTDKVDTEVPSPVAGTVTEIRADVDDTVEVGQVVAVIDSETQTDAGSAAPSAAAADEQAGAARDAAAQDTATRDAAAQDTGGQVAAEAATSRSETDFDVIVLGGGTGGYSCALRAAQLGLSVALVERDKVGGTCLHLGCIPTKAILQSAEIAEHARDAGEFGVNLDYHGVEIARVNEHKATVVERMYKGLQGALESRGIETVHGTGRATGPGTVEVDTGDGTRTLTANSLVLATGSRPREVPFAPFDGERVVSSDHAVHLDRIPSRAAILGAGAIGMEFATAWHAFGVEVTVVELEDRLLPLEDADSSKEIQRQFRRQGIEALTGARMTGIDKSDGGVVCTVEVGGDVRTLEADLLLVAVGRAPVTEGAGIDTLGVATDDRGFIDVDGYCRTNVPDVYALGDVIPTLMLAHASFQEGMLVGDLLAGLDTVPIDYAGVPRVTYCHPEVASVGLTEQEARDRGHDVVVERYPFQALGRAQMMKATGSVKVVAEADGTDEGAGRVLGIHIVGPRATDLISEGQLIYNWEAYPIDVARLIHAHPSLGEALGEAHLALAGRALHG